MDTLNISDFHFNTSSSNDYESLINCCSSSSSSSSTVGGGNGGGESGGGSVSRRDPEKRTKHNTVINRIRRFARSQSQIRHGSRGHDHINSENLVSKTKDLYRDVKRRFSSFNSSIEPTDRRIVAAAAAASSSSSIESHHKSIINCEPNQASSVSRLRRYASDESLPTSESGCGSSVKTSSLSTDSNRSSICTVNDSTNECSIFKGPFIGQGIALADCTPCPYDKDALVFKKGDLVNIIAKNDSGTWIGMANGKIGHFKFINVEEISSIGSGMRSTGSSSKSTSESCSSIVPSSSNLNPSSFVANHYEDIIRNLLSNVNIYLENSLKGLFRLIGLDDYLSLMKEKGFTSLGSLMNITDSSVLEVIGITCQEHQQTILSIASIIRKLQQSHQSQDNTSKAINGLENGMASMSIEYDRPLAQSAPTTPGFESFQKPLSFGVTAKTTQTNQSSHDVCDDTSNLNGSSPTLPKERRCHTFTNANNSAATTTTANTTTTSSVQLEQLSALRLRKKRDRRQSESDNIKRAQSGGDILDTDLYHVPKYGSYDHRKSLDTNVLIKKLEHGYEMRNAPYSDVRLSSKKLSTSKSVFDLKYNDNSHLQDSTVHCGHSTKKRFKKLLNSADRKSLTSISFEDRRFGLTSKPLSSSLLDALSNLLKEENIDLTCEPYSDNSGFCGIPPALVQRYAEELETDIYDIAETLDYIRLCCLLNRSGRQGIPNDFLADSCNGPGTDWANYESLHSWLLSLGLPMYESKLKECDRESLWDIISMREDDLIACGINNKRHLRSLTTAIGALSVNQHKIGKT